MVTSVFDILTLVALLAEGVDRNLQKAHLVGPLCRVALLAEGVDRNIIPYSAVPRQQRRPPRGGRG